jgi:hypothetical protein
MEVWAKKFDGEWGEKYGKQMEAWGERFAAQMEKRTERLEQKQERLEVRRESIEKVRDERMKSLEKKKLQRKEHINNSKKLAKERKVLIEQMVGEKVRTKVKKTIIIKMPKDAKIKVNVRHGELKFTANINNLKADLSHTRFIAQSINGSSTSINAAYSPVSVAYWNLGELNLKHVRKAELENVKHMVLTSNSSDVEIQNLLGSAIIDNNYGDLKIYKIDDAFTNLNIILQNSEVVISLPKTAYNLQYKGNRSSFSHPEKSSNENVSSYSINNLNTSKTIVVNAKYSEVVME